MIIELSQNEQLVAPQEESKLKAIDLQLFQAIGQGNNKQVENLLNQGANPNARDNNGLTPLYYAVKAQNLALVNILLAMGANLNSGAQYPLGICNNNPVLTEAVATNNIAIVKVISEAVANAIADAKNNREDKWDYEYEYFLALNAAMQSQTNI